ncbi:MAG: DUF488 family protein [Coriobacteriia bacterium]|nr:DUF488 family protein [Coriobacteriia bacterium]
MIQVKSVFDPIAKSDGYRIIVVHHWPQGAPRGKAAGCDWIKSLGPTESLRGWMKKNPRKIDQFIDKYLAELGKNDAATDKVCAMHTRFGGVTVLSVPTIDDKWPMAETLARFLGANCDD